MTPRRPQLIVLDGATGSGKSLTLSFLRERYSPGIVVGSKFTTRKKRLVENDWEFTFAAQIPDRLIPYSFESVGCRYAVDIDQAQRIVDQGLVYAITCTDSTTINKLKTRFECLLIYIYRPTDLAQLTSLIESRGPVDPTEARLRQEEIYSLVDHYAQNLHSYDHVILNIRSKADVILQVSALLSYYKVPAWSGVLSETT